MARFFQGADFTKHSSENHLFRMGLMVLFEMLPSGMHIHMDVPFWRKRFYLELVGQLPVFIDGKQVKAGRVGLRRHFAFHFFASLHVSFLFVVQHICHRITCDQRYLLLSGKARFA